jgi:para-nitrobenzyl esterase
MKTLAVAEKEGQALAEKLKAKNIRELRVLPAESIQNAFGFYSPIVDGYVMPASVAEIFKRSKQTHVPFLTGWNADEGFLLGIKEKAAFAAEARDFGSDSALFTKYFPSSTDTQSLASQTALSVDKTIGIPQYVWVLKQNENNSAKTFLYRFIRKPPAVGEKKRFGAYHTAEIGYALHNLDSIQRSWEAVDRKLEEMMSSYWVNFTKTGNPNGPRLPNWPAFTDQDPQAMFFEDDPSAKRLPDRKALDFLYARYPGR